MKEEFWLKRLRGAEDRHGLVSMSNSDIGYQGADTIASFIDQDHRNAVIKNTEWETDYAYKAGSPRASPSPKGTRRARRASAQDLEAIINLREQKLKKPDHPFVLEMGNANIDVRACERLAHMLERSTRVQCLRLSNNAIQDGGAQKLAQALQKNVSLQRLHVGNNGITDVGARALAQCLHFNHTLSKLWLDANEITPVGLRCFAEVLGASDEERKYSSIAGEPRGSPRSPKPNILHKRNKTLLLLNVDSNREEDVLTPGGGTLTWGTVCASIDKALVANNMRSSVDALSLSVIHDADARATGQGRDARATATATASSSAATSQPVGLGGFSGAATCALLPPSVGLRSGSPLKSVQIRQSPVLAA